MKDPVLKKVFATSAMIELLARRYRSDLALKGNFMSSKRSKNSASLRSKQGGDLLGSRRSPRAEDPVMGGWHGAQVADPAVVPRRLWYFRTTRSRVEGSAARGRIGGDVTTAQ